MKKPTFLKHFLFLTILLTGVSVYSQTPEEEQKIVSQYNLDALRQLENQFSEQYKKDQDKILKESKLRSIQQRIELPNDGVAELQFIGTSNLLSK